MSERDIALIDELRTTENALVEFKKDNIDPKLIAKLCSALSNAARIEEKDFAYVMWGIDDATHEVVGTRFNPDDVKNGQQYRVAVTHRRDEKKGYAAAFEKSNAAQATAVINAAMKEGLIKPFLNSHLYFLDPFLIVSITIGPID